MKKVLIPAILCIAILFSNVCFTYSGVQIAEKPDIKVVIDGEKVTFKDVPIILNGRTLLPLRELLVSLGVQNDNEHIIWDSNSRSITIIKEPVKVFLTVDKVEAKINDSEVIKIDTAPVIYKNRTYIPARFVAQSFGKEVSWDGNTNSVYINEPGKTELKIITWENEAVKHAINSINEFFTEKYGDIKVNFEAIQRNRYDTVQEVRLAANDVDIMAISGGLVAPIEEWAASAGLQKRNWQRWIENGQLQDITDQPFVKNYTPESIKAACTMNGRVYSINTATFGISGVYYSKSAFDKAGIKSVPKTYSELMDVCEKLKVDGITPFGIGGKDEWPIDMISQGIFSKVVKNDTTWCEKIWNGQMKWTDPMIVDVYEKIQKIFEYAETDFMDIDYDSMPQRFASGKFAMMADGTWRANQIANEIYKFEFGYFPLPGTDDPTQDYLVGMYDLGWCIASGSKNKDNAYKWLSFFSEKENYYDYINTIGYLPTQDNIGFSNTVHRQFTPYIKNVKVELNRYYRPKEGTPIDMFKKLIDLKPIGKTNTARELMEKFQAEWDSVK